MISNKFVSPVKRLEKAIVNHNLGEIEIMFNDISFSEQINLTKNAGPFNLACAYGHLDIVKYLLTSPNVKNPPDIGVKNLLGFELACMNNHSKIIQYLTSSPELKYHVNKDDLEDSHFNLCLKNNKLEVLKHLIFDLNIEKNKNISIYLLQTPNEEVEQMFKIRGLHNNIALDLRDSSVGISKPPKSNKI